MGKISRNKEDFRRSREVLGDDRHSKVMIKKLSGEIIVSRGIS